MVTLLYSRPALADLKAIYVYISNDSPAHAKRFIVKLKERIKILKVHPEIGREIFPGRFPNLRQVLHKSYRIIYQYENKTVTIITVHHQSRLIENIDAIKKYII